MHALYMWRRGTASLFTLVWPSLVMVLRVWAAGHLPFVVASLQAPHFPPPPTNAAPFSTAGGRAAGHIGVRGSIVRHSASFGRRGCEPRADDQDQAEHNADASSHRTRCEMRCARYTIQGLCVETRELYPSMPRCRALFIGPIDGRTVTKEAYMGAPGVVDNWWVVDSAINHRIVRQGQNRPRSVPLDEALVPVATTAGY